MTRPATPHVACYLSHGKRGYCIASWNTGGRKPSTGAGKTAVLDIALFHLALTASDAVRTPAPRRIVFAVDRRVIVDQAYNRARKLQRALENTKDERVQAMAEALQRLD